ncbi:hypothetical protein EZV73_13995 [Acidaminobacter sp. JC074]|uniref:hypothetical protein n=1 Tax=Acidaminobacter sp. JC074 TaxID=2530199 RepID=UPI001F0D2387|nr:hypothetical protein [Acidaminobacter sp. JC074]MCH4888701.1 hypothetical protein [Acidaminobacter sp. JC074]
MNQIFLEQMAEVNEKILKGHLDESLRLLLKALDYYEDNDLVCEIPNVFYKASNVIEGFSRRILLLDTMKRIISLSRDRENKLTYVKYYALAHGLYGAPEKALEIIDKYSDDTLDGLYIELQNVKGIVLSKLDRHDETLKIYLDNYELTKSIHYKPGLRLVHNIGSAYARLHDYDNAIKFIKEGIEFDFENTYITNGVMAMIELADVYVSTYQFDLAKRTLKKVMNYDVVTENQNMYLQFCMTMYKYNKAVGKYEDALFYHEILKDLEIQQNMEYYSGLLTSEIRRDDDDMGMIDHEIMADKLRNTNTFLKKTIAKSHEVQQELMAKNQELEATMESLNSTQEKLLVAEKRNVLDSMFINIANHMNTPLGVMNTSTSHLKNVNDKTKKKFEEGKLTKNDFINHMTEIKKSLSLYEESMNKVIGFVDTLKLYRTNDSEEVKHVDVKTYLEEIKASYKRYKGIEDIGIICHAETTLYINTSLFEKCIDLVSKKLLINAERNGFDMEVSTESNIVTIGVGDFKTTTETESSSDSLVDSYDLYIIQTIVENLLGGRFIKFKDRGRDYYQFIFNLES